MRNWLLSAPAGVGLAGAWSRIQEQKYHKTFKVAARTDEDRAATRSWELIGGVVGLLGYPVLLILRLALRHPKTSVVLLALAGWCGLVSVGQAGELNDAHGPGYPADHHPVPPGHRDTLKPKRVTETFGFKR